MATLLANREVTAKVDRNQDRVATSFVKDKKGRKGLLTGVWKSEYIWEAPDLEKVEIMVGLFSSGLSRFWVLDSEEPHSSYH
jgi:hypothetical protein